MAAVHSNIFCSRADLHTEADVEVLVAERLFALLRYPDDKIHRKEALDEIEVPRGSQKEAYRPDYVLLDSRGRPRVVFDAKSPNETPENYRYQVAGYALGLNSRFSGENPIRLVVVSNGITTVVWPWDDAKPILQLQFSDFDPDNTKFIQLRSLLSYDATAISEAVKDVFEFRRPPMAELLSTFDAAHQLIWKKEKLGPTDAFYEFTKLIFVKLREDQRISRKISYGEPVGLADFNFSTHWIAEQQDRGIDDNPVANSLFRRIREELEHSIQEGNKKRIFADGEGVNLKPSTVTEVVKLFQNYNLHGIDEDLNGRMFETFLNATVRGKELGQFFTPRSVVKYMAQCAPLDVDRHRTPRVLDGCCGSGGFLIEAMALLTHKIIALDQLTSAERTNRLRELHQERLYGIEANDKVTRVSRLNMYLHGDGGSRIYTADTLDKSMFVEAGIDDESQRWLRELRAIIVDRSVRFNVVLTNPPFSMSYKRTDPTESAIIKMYDVATTSSVRSNVLFLERYLDLLDEDGELLTVIDNTVLNGKDQQHVRDFLLKNFIIRQVVALPFNTFFRAQANVQTSILHLRKKRVDEAQGSIFMGILNNVGHNDGQHQTPKRDNTGRLFGAWTQWNNAGSIEEQSWPNESNDENLDAPARFSS